MDLSLSGQTSIFGGVFFVFKSVLGIERQKKLLKNSFLTRKPRSQNRTWPNTESCLCTSNFFCSQVFLTSDVLNSDENTVNIALITLWFTC